MKANEIGVGVFIIIVLAALLFLAVKQDGWDKDAITAWASENACEIVEIERTVFDHGPFWFVDEDDRIYKVKVKDRLEHPRVAYFRFKPWGFDQEWSN